MEPTPWAGSRRPAGARVAMVCSRHAARFIANVSRTNIRMSQNRQTQALSRALLDKLWDQCNWAHEIWTLRRALIDGNRRKRTLEEGPHIDFIAATGNALQEYVLLQIAKLHDPAVMSGRVCLTLKYVVEYGGWNQATQRKLRTLKKRLDDFQDRIRPARNRLISHNDLATVLNGQRLGTFEAGADQRYFKTLNSFMSSAYQGAVGGPCAPFATLKTEAQRAVAVLAATTAPKDRRRRKARGRAGG